MNVQVVYTVNKVVHMKCHFACPMAYKTESEISCEYMENSCGKSEQAHTSGTAVHICVRMFACLVSCLLELTTLLQCKF